MGIFPILPKISNSDLNDVIKQVVVLSLTRYYLSEARNIKSTPQSLKQFGMTTGNQYLRDSTCSHLEEMLHKFDTALMSFIKNSVCHTIGHVLSNCGRYTGLTDDKFIKRPLSPVKDIHEIRLAYNQIESHVMLSGDISTIKPLHTKNEIYDLVMSFLKCESVTRHDFFDTIVDLSRYLVNLILIDLMTIVKNNNPDNGSCDGLTRFMISMDSETFKKDIVAYGGPCFKVAVDAANDVLKTTSIDKSTIFCLNSYQDLYNIVIYSKSANTEVNPNISNSANDVDKLLITALALIG